MGWIKNTKAADIAKEATRALEEGRTVFTPMLNSPSTNSGMTGSVGGWAEMLEAIEAAGWRLEHWSIGQDKHDKPQAYPLFRRA